MAKELSLSSVNYDSEMDSVTEASPIVEHPPPSPEPSKTNVYYYRDKEEVAYMTIIEVPPSKLTLGLFKTRVEKRNYKFYNFRPDSDGTDVKMEVKDDNERLYPSSKGLIQVYCLTDEQATSTQSEPTATMSVVQRSAQSMFHHHNRMSQYKMPKSNYQLTRRPGSFRRPSPIDDSYFDNTDYYTETKGRAFYSDDESMLTDFTSVSQQRIRRRRNRRKPTASRRRFSPSYLSTTYSDASMAIGMITCEFDLRTGNLGLSVCVNSSDGSINIADIARNSLADRDGRLKIGMTIIAVDGRYLAEFNSNNAVDYLRQTIRHNQVLQITCAETQKEFRLPDETVMPINTGAWVQQTMKVNNEVEIYHDMKSPSRMILNGNCLNAGGFPSSGVGSSICSESSFHPIIHDTFHYQKIQKRFKQQNKSMIVQAMAISCGGLDQKKNNKKGFPADTICEWLRTNVEGLEETKKCQKFASELVKDGFITQTVTDGFSRETYYTFTNKAFGNRKALDVMNGQKPAMDDTMVVPHHHKTFGYKLKKLFCVGKTSTSSVGTTAVSRPPNDPIPPNENMAPLNGNLMNNVKGFPVVNQVQQSTARQYPRSTLIP